MGERFAFFHQGEIVEFGIDVKALIEDVFEDDRFLVIVQEGIERHECDVRKPERGRYDGREAQPPDPTVRRDQGRYERDPAEHRGREAGADEDVPENPVEIRTRVADGTTPVRPPRQQARDPPGRDGDHGLSRERQNRDPCHPLRREQPENPGAHDTGGEGRGKRDQQRHDPPPSIAFLRYRILAL